MKLPAQFGFIRNHPRVFVLALCGILVFGLWLMQVNPYLNPADDSGRYMILGESLVKTGDLRLLNDVRHLRDTLYVPGFPAIIAFWMRVTGRDPGGVVVPVKFTQLLFLLGTLPLMYSLLERARLNRRYIVPAMLTYALCPALIAYANEVMSEMPLLFLCLASIVLVEQQAPGSDAPALEADLKWTGEPENPDSETETRESPGSGSNRQSKILNRKSAILALVCAVLSYFVRAAGVVLLVSLLVWFWRRYGWKWGASILVLILLTVGIWQKRNSAIIASDPPSTHDTYLRQFTLRDPDDPSAGRIELSIHHPAQSVIGLLGRVRRGFPAYIGNISRAVLYIMAPANTPWLVLFYLIAIPFTLLTLYGAWIAWRRGLTLTCGFCALFWLFVAMWPWRNPRFLVPLIPYILLFLFLGVEAVSEKAEGLWGSQMTRWIQGLACALLLVYYVRVYCVVVPHEHAPTLSGYALGRTKDEAGFYAACEWLKGQEPDTVAMGRPAYLLHLYSGHPTTQVEPSTSPRVQELAYMVKNDVRYLVLDRWHWSHSDRYLGPYLREYGDRWTLAWQDPLGSGVKVYRRIDAKGRREASSERISFRRPRLVEGPAQRRPAKFEAGG